MENLNKIIKWDLLNWNWSIKFFLQDYKKDSFLIFITWFIIMQLFIKLLMKLAERCEFYYALEMHDKMGAIG